MILISVHSAAFVGLYLFMRAPHWNPCCLEKHKQIHSSCRTVMGVVLFMLPTTTTLLTTHRKNSWRLRPLRGFAVDY